MSSSALKGVLLVSMVVLTTIAGLAPIWILRNLRKQAHVSDNTKKRGRVSLLLCLLTCFSGGVFLATCFLHLFPELFEHIAHMRVAHGMDVDFPLAELVSCLGFFMLFFVEELVLMILPNAGHAHGHVHKNGASLHESHRHSRESASLISHVEQHTNARPAAGAEVNASPSVQATQSSSTRTCSDPSCPESTPPVVAEPERCETNCGSVKEYPPILTKSRPHPHSHSTRSVTIVLAIAFHAIIEGVALGVQTDTAKIWAIFISLIVHKLIVAFSIGLQLARTHAHSLRWVVVSMILIAMMTPIGGVIGMIVRSATLNAYAQDFAILLCHGLAVGTFMYVTFFEVLIHERDNEHPNLLKLLFMLIGFFCIGLIRLFTQGHSHSHISDHDDHHAHNHTHDHPH